MNQSEQQPANGKNYGRSSRARKRARPWEYKCDCDSPGAVVKGDDVVCARCLRLERKGYGAGDRKLRKQVAAEPESEPSANYPYYSFALPENACPES
jgi:hypothetical protein